MLMLPREFITLYGTPIPKTYVVPLGGSVRIEPNDDRYIIAFMYTDNNIRIVPLYDHGISLTTTNFSAGALPIIFTHALHGALVNIGWELVNNPAVGDALVMVLEGRMQPPNSRRKRGK